MKGTMEIKYKYKIHTDDEKPINWKYKREDSIKKKGETLVWTNGSVQINESKKTAIEAIFYNKKSLRNKTFIIEDSKLHTSPNA